MSVGAFEAAMSSVKSLTSQLAQADEKVELLADENRKLRDKLQKSEASNARLASQVVALVEERAALKAEIEHMHTSQALQERGEPL